MINLFWHCIKLFYKRWKFNWCNDVRVGARTTMIKLASKLLYDVFFRKPNYSANMLCLKGDKQLEFGMTSTLPLSCPPVVRQSWLSLTFHTYIHVYTYPAVEGCCQNVISADSQTRIKKSQILQNWRTWLGQWQTLNTRRQWFTHFKALALWYMMIAKI